MEGTVSRNGIAEQGGTTRLFERALVQAYRLGDIELAARLLARRLRHMAREHQHRSGGVAASDAVVDECGIR